MTIPSYLSEFRRFEAPGPGEHDFLQYLGDLNEAQWVDLLQDVIASSPEAEEVFLPPRGEDLVAVAAALVDRLGRRNRQTPSAALQRVIQRAVTANDLASARNGLFLSHLFPDASMVDFLRRLVGSDNAEIKTAAALALARHAEDVPVAFWRGLTGDAALLSAAIVGIAKHAPLEAIEIFATSPILSDPRGLYYTILFAIEEALRLPEGKSHLLAALEKAAPNAKEVLRSAIKAAGEPLTGAVAQPDYFDLLEEGVIILNREGRVSAMNAAAAGFAGRHHHTFIGAPFEGVLARDVDESALQQIREIVSTPASGSWQRDIYRNRARSWISIAVHHAQSGTVIRLSRNRAADYLESAVSNSTDAIIAKDMGGRITYWNQGATKLYGYEAEEMLKESVKKLITTPGEFDEIMETLKGGSAFNKIVERVAKNHRRLLVSVAITPIKTGVDIEGACSIGRDVTDENASILVDRAGIIRQASDEAKELYGADLQEGRSFGIWIDSFRDFQRTVDAVMRDGNPTTTELTLSKMQSHGERRKIHAIVRPSYQDHRVDGVWVTWTNLTSFVVNRR